MKMELVLDLKELLWKKRMTQRDLIERIKEVDGREVREATISDLANNKIKRLSLETLNIIINILEVEDVSELFKIKKVS